MFLIFNRIVLRTFAYHEHFLILKELHGILGNTFFSWAFSNLKERASWRSARSSHRPPSSDRLLFMAIMINLFSRCWGVSGKIHLTGWNCTRLARRHTKCRFMYGFFTQLILRFTFTKRKLREVGFKEILNFNLKNFFFNEFVDLVSVESRWKDIFTWF